LLTVANEVREIGSSGAAHSAAFNTQPRYADGARAASLEDSMLMRRLITGTDDSGRSCVITEAEVAPTDGRPGVVVAEELYATAQLPPTRDAVGRSEKLDIGVGQGLAWFVLKWAPGGEWSMHFTETIDLNLVLSGTIDLVLDDGAHRLEPGDTVVVAGVDHAWRTGHDGCTMVNTMIGTPSS
jgi:quercetin dioxygenase-like cupin family protein